MTSFAVRKPLKLLMLDVVDSGSKIFLLAIHS